MKVFRGQDEEMVGSLTCLLSIFHIKLLAFALTSVQLRDIFLSCFLSLLLGEIPVLGIHPKVGNTSEDIEILREVSLSCIVNQNS